jgi:catechol 2,3-dioxygenase-like lactoylglutathione lyase family enzyme
MLRLDHLVVACPRLEEGVTFVEGLLGLPMAGGGQHATMGTHNRLLGLGDLYLEVIAIDPAAPPPGRPRWFDLDRFSGPPRLTNWVVSCDDLEATLAHGPNGWGSPMALARGEYRWQMAVPEDGVLPFAGIFPALIRWQGNLHPAPNLPDRGLRLARLTVTHPDGPALRTGLGLEDDPRLGITTGDPPRLSAEIDTPRGRVTLC